MRKRIVLPIGRNGVPSVTGRQLDTACEQVIRDFDPELLREPHPLDVEAFAERYLGLTVDYLHLTSDHSILGMMVFAATDAIPYYNKENNRAELTRAEANTILIEADLLQRDNARRYRFTVAHECAHALWHGAYFMGEHRQSGPYACRLTDIFGNSIKNESAIRLIEWQANKSASALLMPRTGVYRMMDAAGLCCADAKEQLEMLKLMSREYNVSNEAAMYRLRDLGYRIAPIDTAQLNMIYGSRFLFPRTQTDRI